MNIDHLYSIKHKISDAILEDAEILALRESHHHEDGKYAVLIQYEGRNIGNNKGWVYVDCYLEADGAVTDFTIVNMTGANYLVKFEDISYASHL